MDLLQDSLEFIVSGLFFWQKVLLYKNNPNGWKIGITACILGIPYFAWVELYLYVALDIGLIAIMSYALLANETKKNEKIENALRSLVGLAIVGLCFFVFTGVNTTVELVSTIGLLLGNYLLAKGRHYSGWILNVIAHACAVYLAVELKEWFLFAFQVLSTIVSCMGAIVHARVRTSSV